MENSKNLCKTRNSKMVGKLWTKLRYHALRCLRERLDFILKNNMGCNYLKKLNKLKIIRMWQSLKFKVWLALQISNAMIQKSTKKSIILIGKHQKLKFKKSKYLSLFKNHIRKISGKIMLVIQSTNLNKIRRLIFLGL